MPATNWPAATSWPSATTWPSASSWPGGSGSAGFNGDFASLFAATALQSVQTDLGLTYGSTPKAGAGNTSTTVVSLSGAPLGVPVPIMALAENTAAVGAGATFAVYYDGGTTPAMTGVAPTAGAPVALTGAGAGASLTWAAGASAVTDSWRATCAGLTDRSGNLRHYTQATAAFQPVITPGVNGCPGLLFDGVDDCLNSTFTLPAPGTTPFFLYTVFRQATWVAAARFFGGNAGTTGLVVSAPSTPGIRQYNGTNAGISNNMPVGTWGAVDAMFSASTADYIRAGAGPVVTGLSAGNTSTATIRSIGCNGAGNFANIEVLSVLYATALPAADWRAAVTVKYGASVAVGAAVAPAGIASAEALGSPYANGAMLVNPMVVINGQSNADGRDLSAGVSPNTGGVTYYRNGSLVPFDSTNVFFGGQFGPDLEIGNRLAIATAGGPVIVSKYGIGSTSIATWWNGVTLQATLKAMLNTIRVLGPTNVAYVWVQGETEIADPAYAPGAVQATYQASLTGLAAAVRAEMPGITVRFFIAPVKLNWAEGQVNYAAISAAQAAFVAGDGNAELIPLSDITVTSGVHYVNGDQLLFGDRIAGRIIKSYR